MHPRGHESDPMAFMRPRGDPKNTPSPHAYFYQVFFREGGTLPAPGALVRRRVLLRLGRSSRLGNHLRVVLARRRQRRPYVTRPVNCRKRWVGGGDDGDVEHGRTADPSTARDPCDPVRDPA